MNKHAPIAADFSAKTRRDLAKSGKIIVGSTWLPGDDGSFANGIRGYLIDDNGVGRVRTYLQIESMV